jgi:hypothetical protein
VCNSGYYGNGTTCTAYTVNCMAPTQYEATPRSSTADRTCGTCTSGMTTADNQPGAASCVAAPAPDAGM